MNMKEFLQKLKDDYAKDFRRDERSTWDDLDKDDQAEAIDSICVTYALHFQVLFGKYINHVAVHEGVDFLIDGDETIYLNKDEIEYVSNFKWLSI